MKNVMLLLMLLSFFSCKGTKIPNESSCAFKLPEKEIFVRATKYQGGIFKVFFATDSLSLDYEKDYIKFRTGAYPQIVVDTTDVYINSQYGHTTILEIENKQFNIGVVSDSVFTKTFFVKGKCKYPYTFIGIDTDIFDIGVNGKEIKKGDIYGGW